MADVKDVKRCFTRKDLFQIHRTDENKGTEQLTKALGADNKTDGLVFLLQQVNELERNMARLINGMAILEYYSDSDATAQTSSPPALTIRPSLSRGRVPGLDDVLRRLAERHPFLPAFVSVPEQRHIKKWCENAGFLSNYTFLEDKGIWSGDISRVAGVAALFLCEPPIFGSAAYDAAKQFYDAGGTRILYVVDKQLLNGSLHHFLNQFWTVTENWQDAVFVLECFVHREIYNADYLPLKVRLLINEFSQGRKQQCCPFNDLPLSNNSQP
jgi:hypothetical protein